MGLIRDILKVEEVEVVVIKVVVVVIKVVEVELGITTGTEEDGASLK